MKTLKQKRLRFQPRLSGRVITYGEVESTMKKIRSKNYAKPPTSVDDLKNLLSKDDIKSRYGMCADELFVHEVPSSSATAGQSIICFTESALSHAGNNLKAFADGTHKFFPSFFAQLFIIHFKIGNFVRDFKFDSKRHNS